MTRTTKPLSPAETAELRQGIRAGDFGDAGQDVLRLLDDLDQQKALNAELHKGVCAGYAAILAERNQFERELKDLREVSK